MTGLAIIEVTGGTVTLIVATILLGLLAVFALIRLFARRGKE